MPFLLKNYIEQYFTSLMNEIQKLKEITDSQNQTIEKLKMQNLVWLFTDLLGINK